MECVIPSGEISVYNEQANAPNDTFMNLVIYTMWQEGTVWKRSVHYDIRCQRSYTGIVWGNTGMAFFTCRRIGILRKSLFIWDLIK
jgi:hypothetical protein